MFKFYYVKDAQKIKNNNKFKLNLLVLELDFEQSKVPTQCLLVGSFAAAYGNSTVSLNTRKLQYNVFLSILPLLHMEINQTKAPLGKVDTFSFIKRFFRGYFYSFAKQFVDNSKQKLLKQSVV